MSKRSVRSSSRAGSNKSVAKGGVKKQPTLDPCSQCTKTEKNLKMLECSHGFCQDCVKTLATKEAEEEKDGRSSKMSNKGGKKKAPPKVEYICSVCNPPKEEQDFTHGECAPCKFEEKTSGASGYCVECAELLCESCCTEHNKFKTIRAHNILKGDRIPKDTGAVARLPLLMMCMVHTEKDLEYYCADHDVMGCGACVNTDHRRCERVMFIKDITDEPADRKVVADAAVELREIKRNFEDIHKDTGEILASLEQQRNDIRERRERYKNKIMELLDKLDTSSELEMEEVIQKVSNDMGDDSQSSKEILTKIESSIQVLDAAAGHATDQQMFVAGRRSVSERDKYVNMLNNAMGSIQNVRLDFKPDPTLDRLAKSLEMFDGRSITSNSTRYNQKSRNTFQPQNGFIDHNANQQPINFISRPDISRRPSSEFSSSMSMTQFQGNREGQLPPIINSQTSMISGPVPPIPNSRQTSIMSGSVPDFRSAGLRSNMTEFHGGPGPGMRSLPQTPRHTEIAQQFRSMPPTPRLAMAGAQEPTLYERQMYNQGALPIIPTREAFSEPGRQQRDFVPISPRTVGNNTLVNQGLNKLQVSKPDMLTINHQQMSRRSSLASIASMPLPTKETNTKIKSDILAQTSPIKRRGELTSSGPALKDRKAVLAGQFNVRLQEDSNVCSLKGSASLQDGRIVLADYDNHNVKVFDSKLYRGSQLRLSSGPWDVEVTGPKEVAVSLPFESKIQFIAVTDQLKATRAIKLDMDCYGIVCRNQELIVVCNDYLIGPAVQVVSLTGRIKQTIDTDRSGRRILSDPYYLTVTPTGKLIYVSDKDRIVCMDRHGNVTSIYQDTSLRNARGIDIDNEGNLYVCGYMSNSVHQITMHGIDFRTLITKEQVWDPWSVKFNESSGTIMITSDASDTIKVFSLQ